MLMKAEQKQRNQNETLKTDSTFLVKKGYAKAGQFSDSYASE